MDEIEVVGYKRNDFDKTLLREKRQGGYVPGVMYCGVSSTQHFFVPLFLLEPIVFNKELRLIIFNLEGEMHKCVIKAVQFDPVNEAIIHVDFYEICNENKKIKMRAYVNPCGEAVGVRSGGILITKNDVVTIYGLPKDLPNCINVDVTNLAEGKTLRVSDIEKSDKYTVLAKEYEPLFTVKPAKNKDS